MSVCFLLLEKQPTACLLASAYQRLWLVRFNDAYGRFTWVGHVIQPNPLTTLTLAVKETASRLSPRPEAKDIVSAASDPIVADHAGADRLLRTELQVHFMEPPCRTIVESTSCRTAE
jgi:hypothetical protein